MIKTLRRASLVAVVVALSVCAVAFAAARTRVSIDDKGDGFGGYVHSPKYSCESNRKVRLYEMNGSRPRPSRDTKVGSDVAQPNGPDSQYFIASDATSGKFYVYAPAKRGCKRGRSRVVSR